MTVDRLRVRTRYARRWLRRRHDRLAPRQRQRIALAALLLFISGLILSTLQEKDKRDQWQEENYSHGPVILLVCLWLAWREWPRFSCQPQVRPSAHSLWVLLPAIICFLIGRSQSVPLIEIPGQLGVLFTLAWYFKTSTYFLT